MRNYYLDVCVKEPTIMINKILLPDTLHELITVALQDEDKAFHSPLYLIRMNDWHVASRNSKSRCDVCLAGAVMAFSLKGPIELDLSPHDFGNHKRRPEKLEALDSIRTGEVWEALATFYNRKTMKFATIKYICDKLNCDPEGSLKLTTYSRNRKQWRKEMYSIRNQLKKHNA